MRCPLCLTSSPEGVQTRDQRCYGLCGACGLVFLDPSLHPSAEAEAAFYQTHENSPEDPRYRKFLSQLWDPMRSLLAPGASGLDYGSGPGPTLNLMAQEDGFQCGIYDPFFAPDLSVLENRYDFVACSETAEHFHRPQEAFTRLAGLVKPGGWLGIMTLPPPDDNEALDRWHYRMDPTHVCFYRPETFEWISRQFGFCNPKRAGHRVFLLQKT